MPQLIHPDFRKDSGAYAAAQRHWETLWANIATKGEVEPRWEIHWMKNPLSDGNPIFTALCSALRKGVRIIQEEPGDADDIDVDWWIDDFGAKEDGDATRELVIACCPTAENTPQVEQLLRKWVQNDEVQRDQPNGAAARDDHESVCDLDSVKPT